MDTSPFYAGGTHLAWGAADATIIPVRVDGSFHTVEGKRLQVDSSATRYQRELAYLLSIL
jgi:hypothetical protein